MNIIRHNQKEKNRITQENASIWDLIVVSFKVMFNQLQFWIKPNIWFLLLSIPVITSPAARAAMVFTVSEGLLDPEHSRIDMGKCMKAGFFRNFKAALGLSILKWGTFLLIVLSIYFWMTQEILILKFISVLSLIGWVVWGLANAYLYPVLVEHPEWPPVKIIQKSYSIAARNPFATLTLCIINFLLLVFGLILLGPILCIIPVLREILAIHYYWFFTGRVIPGFMNVEDFYNTLQKR